MASLHDGGMAITRPSEWLDISSNVRKVVIKEFSLSPFPRLLGLGRTDRTFQLIVQVVRQAKGIAFVALEQPFLALLDVQHVHRDISVPKPRRPS